MRERIVTLTVVLALAVAACSSPAASTPPTAAPATPSPAGSAAAPSEAAPPASPEKTSVTVAIASSPDFAQITLPYWQQLVTDAGVSIELQHTEATDIALRAVVAEAADVYVGSLPPLIRAVSETDVDLRLVSIDSQATDYLFIAQPEVTDIPALEGKKVAIGTRGDLTEAVTRAVMTRANFDAETLEWVPIGGSGARLSALLSKQVDMSPLHVAEGFDAVNQGLHSVVRAADYLTDYLQTGLITTQTWLDANPVLAQLLVDKFIDSNRWAAENKDEYIELSKETIPELSDEIRSDAYDLFADIGMFAVNGGMEAEQLENYLEVTISTGSLASDAPTHDVWANPAYVEDYLERNGEQ